MFGDFPFGGRLTRKLAVNAELLWGNCILAIKNRIE